MKAAAKATHISSSQRPARSGGPKRDSTQAHMASAWKAASTKSVVIRLAAANGTSMVAKASAAMFSVPGCRRRARRQASQVQARKASAGGRRAAHGFCPNGATLAAIAQ